jgi:hypothetical protein
MTDPVNPVFPTSMVAECPYGHRWPVTVTWHPTTLTMNGWDKSVQVPSPAPRYCEACFLQERRCMAPVKLLHETAAHWSQQLSGLRHIALDRLSDTPPLFRACLLEELRAEWHLSAPTIADVYALLLTIVKPRMAKASWRSDHSKEDVCVG